MKKTLTAAAFALAVIGGGIAIQSPALAQSAGSGAALAGPDYGSLIVHVAARRSEQAPNRLAPQPQQEPQDYPKYHDQATASYYSPPVKANPCHFTQAEVEGQTKQVEVCN